ncbi:hypothetical protein YC2023_033908 [Brassica napus]
MHMRHMTMITLPMTEISGEKCKRCGIYEQDSLISDEEFDEWEALSFRLLC